MSAEPEPMEPIAIVGMAGRFPGAADLRQHWDNLRRGVEAITFFSDEELAAAGVDAGLLRNPRYVRARGVLQDAELFDARGTRRAGPRSTWGSTRGPASTAT